MRPRYYLRLYWLGEAEHRLWPTVLVGLVLGLVASFVLLGCAHPPAPAECREPVAPAVQARCPTPAKTAFAATPAAPPWYLDDSAPVAPEGI